MKWQVPGGFALVMFGVLFACMAMFGADNPREGMEDKAAVFVVVLWAFVPIFIFVGALCVYAFWGDK